MVPSKNTALKYFKVSSTCQEMDHPSTYQENVESYGQFFQESKVLDSRKCTRDHAWTFKNEQTSFGTDA